MATTPTEATTTEAAPSATTTTEVAPAAPVKIYTWTVNDDGGTTTTREVQVSIEAQQSKDCFSEDQPCTGHAVWFAALNLCDLIVERHNNRNNMNESPKALNILELGSGPGLSGILHAKLSQEHCPDTETAAAPAQRHVHVLTDGDEAVVDLLQRNCQRNGLTKGVAVQTLWWGEESSANELMMRHGCMDTGFDVILGADLVYGKHQHNLQMVVELMMTVRQMLAPDHGIFYLAFTRRNLEIEYVLETAQKHGLVGTLEEDYCYDIFESNTDGQTCFWRDAIYSFRRREEETVVEEDKVPDEENVVEESISTNENEEGD